jgi:hypothetical protein
VVLDPDHILKGEVSHGVGLLWCGGGGCGARCPVSQVVPDGLLPPRRDTNLVVGLDLLQRRGGKAVPPGVEEPADLHPLLPVQHSGDGQGAPLTDELEGVEGIREYEAGHRGELLHTLEGHELAMQGAAWAGDRP